MVGFSKGGWIAILASSRLHNPALSFVFMAACGPCRSAWLDPVLAWAHGHDPQGRQLPAT